MESFENFTELFNKLKKEKNNNDLMDILKNGPSYFHDLSISEIGLALSVFLNDKTGFLNFLADDSDKTMEGSIVRGFEFLNFIVQQFYRLLDRYVIRIKALCQSAIIRKFPQIIKKAAADCFESLVKMCQSDELQLNETVQELVRTFHLCTDADRGKSFKVLASIAKYHPEAISPAYSHRIFQRVMNDFEQSYSKCKPGSQPNELAIHLKLLNNMMTNSSPQESSDRSEYYKKLYHYIKNLSNNNWSQKLKFVGRASIVLLGNHMSTFIDYVYESALYWHNTLLKWIEFEGENRTAAFNTLSVYYKQMGMILQSRNTESGREVYEHLAQYFLSKLAHGNTDSITLQLSIRGFGHMAGACKNYSNANDVARMFSLVAQIATITYANNIETNDALENIAYYQEALSEILLHVPEVSPDQLTALLTLSLVLVKRFPDLPVSGRSLAAPSLMKTIRDVGKACRRSQGDFIQKLVYEGIIWSCSHALFVDAETEREMKNLNERPVCYKNYLPLWQPMLCPDKMTHTDGSFAISMEIFKNMINTCVRLIRKLNLDVRIEGTSCETGGFDIPIAVNDTDFRVFANLIDLFVDILENSEPHFMKSGMNWFLCEIIRKSNQHPLISGFYKLAHVVLKLHNSLFDSGEQNVLDGTPEFLSKYLSDTVDKMASFSGELQTSCFNLIFEMPILMAENMLDRLVFTFKTAFSLGQSNFETAQSALRTVEKWAKTIRGEGMEKFLIQVVPSLEAFLQSDENAVKSMRGILLNERKITKNIVLTDHERTLQEFQRRILLFLGSLNSEVTSNLAAERFCVNKIALGDGANLLKYTLLYKDIKPDIYLDTILPRTIELALSSRDRRTRVIACEVLHSIVIVMLGRTMQFLSSNPDRLLPIFEKICPVLLRLGSDSDQVIQQLFYPLMIQLTHWYSSKMMLRSSETAYLIEVLFDLLISETNIALSDFCGTCLAEFVKWSIKQSTDADLQTQSTNIAAIISKITNFASHPSIEKRIGAAVAFNYLYAILRESNIIIDIFWMELLYCFIKSLNECDSRQIFKSLEHIERVIENRYELFNQESSRRRKPAEFKGTLLKDAVDWLLGQCGSLDSNCRSKSMELLGRVSKYIQLYGSVQKVLANYVNMNSVRGLNEIILKNLHPKIDTLSVETMRPLLRTLDCYIWILDENLLSLDLLFTDRNTHKDTIFNCIANFVYIVSVKREGDVEETSEFAKQYRGTRALKCKIILRIFDFVKVLLNKIGDTAGTNSLSYIPTFFWNGELYSLISTLIFKPEVTGFDLQNLEMTEYLPSSLQKLLNTFVKTLDDKHLSQLRVSILGEIKNKYEDFLASDQIFKNDTSVEFKSYIKGLILLETFDKSGKLYERSFNDDDSAVKIKQIFNLLKKEQHGQVLGVHIESSGKEYLEKLLEFLFQKCEPKTVITLVSIAGSKTELIHENSITIYHGEYFMNLFGNSVFNNLMKNVSKSMDTLLSDSLKEQFDTVLIILEDLLSYVTTNKRSFEGYIPNLEKEFVRRFTTFRNLIKGVESRKEKVTNLYSLLVKFSKNPSEICSSPNELYSWIMQGLMGYLDLEYKTRMLNNFLPCIVDETLHKKQELTNCLHKLKSDYYSIDVNELPKGSLDYSNIIASFQTLARHLPMLKSVALFDSVIYLTIGNVQCLWDDGSSAYLASYFNEISTDDSQRSLQILYKYFMNTENFNARLEILNKLLLKCIHFCNTNAIEHFFEENIRQIYEIVSEDLLEKGPSVKNLMVSKIGCYNLLEIMFAKVSLEKISGANSKIVRNSIGTTETGKKLFQALNSNVLNVRKLKTNCTESKELMRLLHCAAYNCSIAIVSLKCEENFYVLLFAENKAKSQLIWENIVDTNRSYKFKQDFKEIPRKYKRLINIRKESSLKEAQNYAYIKSYNLAASTLNEDLSCFDLYEANLWPHLAVQNTDEEVLSLTFESDDLNNHECMASICGVITHMVSRNIFNLPSDGERSTMPKWMKHFLASLNATISYNVKLFIIKVIMNMQEVFKPYAKSFLTPILSFLNNHFKNSQNFNYVIKDILIMLIDWQSVAVPSENTDRISAQNLLEMLIRNADNHQRLIYKCNVEIIDMLVGAWQSCLQVPQGILNIKNASSKFTVQIILTFLSNNKQESLASMRDVAEYLIELLDNLDEDIVLRACNAFGLILSFLDSKNAIENKQWIIDNIQTSVIDRSQLNHNKYIKSIHEIHRFYPNIVNYCFKQLTSSYFKIDKSEKVKCLELLLSALPKFLDKEIIAELGFIKFQDIFTNKILLCQQVALRMIQKLLDILEPTDFLQFALLIVPYSKDPSVTQREIVMEIFIAVYKKYGGNIEDNIAVDKLKDLSRHILLLGLLDTNECLQQKLLHFWTEDGNMADQSTQRMLEIFDMYDADLESSYLPILPLMMLHLVSNDPEFRKKMFEPLINCKFEDYEVVVQWRSKNSGLVAPLFTSSFASQISRYYPKSNPSFTRFNKSINQSLFLRGSQSLQFQQTVTKYPSSSQTTYTVGNEFGDSTGNVEKIPSPSENKKSKRILQNTAVHQDNIRQRQISKNLHRDEMLRKEVDFQRNSIKICRKYRIGDFPDIEITHSSLIEPLQELVKSDEIIARDLTVAIFCSMLKEISANEEKEFLDKLAKSLDFILSKTNGSKPLIATVLEILLNSREIHIAPNVIAKVSKSCGLLSLGALLSEEKMISGCTTENCEPVAKKSKLGTLTHNAEDYWLQLADIYESMNDFDTVQSIFGCDKFGKELQKAASAQGTSKWSLAKAAYETAYEVHEGLVKDYCQESLFACLAHLSDWEKINDHIKKELNGDFDTLWEKPINENWIASWTFQAQIHAMLRNDCSNRFLIALNDWVNTKDKFAQLKGLYGEEIAIFYIYRNREFSENCLTSGLEKIRQEWRHSNSLYYKQNMNKYLKLRGLSDIKTYLEGIKDKNRLIPNVRSMLTSWNNSVPSNQDNLLLWDKYIAYRLYFFGLLPEQLEIETLNEKSEILDVINDAIVRQCLNVAQVAYCQINSHFMKKHLQYSEQYLEDEDSNLRNEWQLAFAKYKYLCYTDSKTQERRVKNYTASWKGSHKLLINDSLCSQVQFDIRQHISRLIIELQRLLIKSEPIATILLEDPGISQYLPPRHNEGSVLKQLSDYCLMNLEQCCTSADSNNKASCYFRISMYCHSMRGYFETGLNLSREFIHSTLNAMRYGSLDASQYFLCLLHLDYSDNPEFKEIFQNRSEDVETWMFLKWQAQLLSHVGTPSCCLVAPILLRLAETYPHSFIYTFRMTKEMNKSLKADPLITKLTRIVSKIEDLELFLEAIKYVVQPELYLKYHLGVLESNMLLAADVRVDTLLATVYPSTGDDEKILVRGKLYKSIDKFEEKIKQMVHLKGKDLHLHKKQIVNELDELLQNRMKDTRKVLLKEYSPWLHDYSGRNIEVPGQYDVDKKPVLEYHAKIVKLIPEVTILQSLRKPIKITMLGNDGRKYSFLVKFGEDLRTDERIEQLFTLMNKILQGDADCRRRQLSIDTYLVIPLTGSLGLIQWVDDTRSLNDIINSALTDKEKSERENIMTSYTNWMRRLGVGQPIEALYSESILRYGREEVSKKYDDLKNRVGWDILRKAFKQASGSPESFFTLRHNFITSYATLCIAQWILGIGDRNLSNILISYASGKALGIDFGFSFDVAIDLSVPELMPFRLTPQILGLLRPFDENGLLKLTMIYVLQAIKRGRDPLLACMDIFVKEPSLDWLPRKKNSEYRQENSDTKWYPTKKLDIVVEKLNGAKPSRLTLLQIKNRYGDTEYFSKYIDIINGSDNDLQLSVRSKHPDHNLTVEEQVECLLDQATDPNVLARTWLGWEPWI